ncbi:MAG: hypothetical protein N2Z74_08350, partial [Syntrophales bacterium]|nr:hypothetical protein [Syntrophales bacterium]
TDDRPDGMADVAYEGTQRRALAVWVHQTGAQALGPAGYALYHSVFNPDSLSWSSPAAVPGTDDTASDTMPTVSAAGVGRFLAVWVRDLDGRFFTVKENDKGEPLFTGGANVDNTNTVCTLAYSIFSNGAWWTAPKTVPAPGAFTRLTPHATALQDGRVALVFIQKEGTQDKLLFSIYNPDTDQWGDAVVVDADGYLIEEPKVHAYTEGVHTVVKVLYRKLTGKKDGLYVTKRNLGQALSPGESGFSAPVLVTGGEGSLMWPAAAVTADGSVVFAATETRAASGPTPPSGQIAVGVAATVAGATLTKSYTEAPAFAGDSVAAVNVTAGVQVVRAGTYRLQATLADGAGRVIQTATGEAQQLTPGTTSLNLPFSGRVIRAAGSDGPYRIVDIQLIDATAAPVIADRDATGFLTRAYQVAQFLAARLGLDKQRYVGTTEVMTVRVMDEQRTGTAVVSVKSSAMTSPLAVTLTPTAEMGVFAGVVRFSTTAAGTDAVKVENAGIIEVSYYDVEGALWRAAASWVET